MRQRVRRFHGAVLATVTFALVGAVADQPALILAGVVPLAYLAATSLSTAPRPDGLVVDRSLDPATAPPGRPIAVTLTVTNESDRTYADLRVVDGVPYDLAVSGGSPRAGTTLEPGESETIRYVMISRRGVYQFDPPTISLRGVGAGAVSELHPEVYGDDRFAGRLDADAPPLEQTGNNRIGQLTSDDPGEGISFHSTREYAPGDNANRIDWRHYAKDGELTTVAFERQVSATVVLVVDARQSARVVAGPGRPTAVELGTYAATQAMTDLLSTGHDVAIAVVGMNGPDPAGLHWLSPRGGSDQRTRGLDLFRHVNRTQSSPVDAYAQFRKVLELAPPEAQVALFSPLLDDPPVDAIETWLATDRPVSVLSPDVVTTNTLGGQQTAVLRRARLARCQRLGGRPIDWRRGTPLALVIEQAFALDARVPSGRPGGGR